MRFIIFIFKQVGLEYNHLFGYGVLDAAEMVLLAKASYLHAISECPKTIHNYECKLLLDIMHTYIRLHTNAYIVQAWKTVPPRFHCEAASVTIPQYVLENDICY